MPYYKVRKTMRYTVDVYMEAATQEEAVDASGQEEGAYNNDDIWYDSDAHEITEEEYLEETK